MFYDGFLFDVLYVKWFMMDYLMNGSGTFYMVDGVVDDVVIEDMYMVCVKFVNFVLNLLWNLSFGYVVVLSKGVYEKYGDDYG